MAQVIVGREALGELISLARRAAFDLTVTSPELADALEGSAADLELSVYQSPLEDRVAC